MKLQARTYAQACLSYLNHQLSKKAKFLTSPGTFVVALARNCGISCIFGHLKDLLWVLSTQRAWYDAEMTVADNLPFPLVECHGGTHSWSDCRICPARKLIAILRNGHFCFLLILLLSASGMFVFPDCFGLVGLLKTATISSSAFQAFRAT